MSPRQRYIFDAIATLVLTAAIFWGIWSFYHGQVVYDLFRNDPSRFRDYLLGMGVWASFMYVWLVILEVVISVIPGWFVYPVGGALFGFTQTVLMVLLANFIGASVCFWIGRRWGTRLLERFIAQESLKKFNYYMEKHGTLAIFLLKINPITSLDIWNYVAGASPIKFWKFTLSNLAGIIPLVAVSAALGEQSYKVAPQLLGAMVILTIVFLVWFLINFPAKIKRLMGK
jgi:uncharacterized membrane protein YdjX (TVP38/TMEM64 family)